MYATRYGAVFSPSVQGRGQKCTLLLPARGCVEYRSCTGSISRVRSIMSYGRKGGMRIEVVEMNREGRCSLMFLSFSVVFHATDTGTNKMHAARLEPHKDTCCTLLPASTQARGGEKGMEVKGKSARCGWEKGGGRQGHWEEGTSSPWREGNKGR